MQGIDLLSDRHEQLAERFASLARARGERPVFAIEHGLDDLALVELRTSVSRLLEEDPQLTRASWSLKFLPMVVIASEVGYRYRGTGTDFWPLLSQELGVEAGTAFRIGLSELFELGHRRLRLFRPGDSPWERHFPHISWPIGNAVVPLEIQPQLTDALRRAVRAGISAEDTEGLLDYIRALAAGHASRRFENWLLQRDVALEVMRRLLAPESEGWLADSILIRIDRDIRRDWGAFRAITEARRTIARRSARLSQIVSSRYVLALDNGVPRQLAIRGPVLSAQLRDEVVAALRIHGDRIRAVDGMHAISLSSFLAGGEIALRNICPFPVTPLRRDHAVDLDEGAASSLMRSLQPLEPEFFLVEPDGLTAQAIFPSEKIRPDVRIIRCLGLSDEGSLETRILSTSAPSDAELLRRRGFAIANQVPTLQLLGLPAPGFSNRFLSTFPVLVTRRVPTSSELLIDGSRASGEILNICGVQWKALRPEVGRHLIELSEGRELDRLEFEVIEPPDVEPAAIKVIPENANVSDLESGELEIRVTAPLALESVPIRIRVVSPSGPTFVSEGVIERLPARITGRSPVLYAIQSKLPGLQASESGLRLSVDVGGLFEKVFSLPPVRRELRYDWERRIWTRIGQDTLVLPSVSATIEEPLLNKEERDWLVTRLIVPDAGDHESLAAGLILPGQESSRFELGDRCTVTLPELLREPTSSGNGVGLIELARANVAWQLAEAHELLSNWRRWNLVEELEAALVEQLCGKGWRGLEAGIDLSILSPHEALLRCADGLDLISGKDLPDVERTSDKEFLRDRLIARLSAAVPDVSEALLKFSDDLAGKLDLAVIEAYEDLRHQQEADGIKTFEEVDMSRPAELWRKALEDSREVPLLPMFRPFILPEARWLALITPIYSELTEDDLIDLLDSTHVDASRRSGFRWLGRAELRTMLQLWLSPKTMVETEGWRDLLARGLSDVRTSRAVRYVALRRKLALRDLPDAGAF
ncbi:hypothetical protein [Aestuariivirga litoralis]|uniref:hypothetical protein n=1 Tax=Aestuariivirga litoralis TaxID=2650924 RepID=UPI0011B48E54|nr:hypothetical protein [Aestuariivirga litoralis]